MKTIIFDFDGTIADTFWIGFQIVNGLADEFDFKKVKEEEVDKYRQMTSREVVKALSISWLKLPLVAARVRKEMSKIIGQAKLFEGIKETLTQLRQSGHKFGILSSNSLENLEFFINNNDLKVFDFIQSGRKLFGKDRILNLIVVNNGLNKDNVVYVGDETRDIKAARRAGLKVIAVSWGYNAREALEQQKPDLIVDVPEELINAVEKV